MDQLKWVTPDNEIIDLDDGVNTFALANKAGMWLPSFGFVETVVPEKPGTRLSSLLTQARSVDLPLAVLDDNLADLEDRLRDLAVAVNPEYGDGKLRVTRGSNTRDLHCRYRGGFEAVVITGGLAKLILGFKAFVPYWYATSPVVDTWSLSTPTGYFLPMPPLRVTSSAIFADVTVSNGGDVAAWPVWTISGPGSAIVIENLSTDKKIDLPVTLSTGESVAIDTRQDAKTITKNDGTNLFSSLTDESALWPLQKGNNSVRVTMNSADANSSVALSYYPRYLSV